MHKRSSAHHSCGVRCLLLLFGPLFLPASAELASKIGPLFAIDLAALEQPISNQSPADLTTDREMLIADINSCRSPPASLTFSDASAYLYWIHLTKPRGQA